MDEMDRDERCPWDNRWRVEGNGKSEKRRRITTESVNL